MIDLGKIIEQKNNDYEKLSEAMASIEKDYIEKKGQLGDEMLRVQGEYRMLTYLQELEVEAKKESQCTEQIEEEINWNS